MGFGSYDEGEQESGDRDEEAAGEDVTAEVRGTSKEDGEATIENSVEEMLETFK